jgi:PAS domain-containing protein
LGWALSRPVPLLAADGEIVEWLGAAQDITAKKNAQDQIRDAAERLRFMAESMPQKITTTKPDGFVDYMNAQWLRPDFSPGEAFSAGGFRRNRADVSKS